MKRIEGGEHDDDREFTPQERIRLREMMMSQARVEWFWGSVAVWTKWIFGAVAAVAAIWSVFQGWGR